MQINYYIVTKILDSHKDGYLSGFIQGFAYSIIFKTFQLIIPQFNYSYLHL